ncbi:hypothetical protein Bca4012_029436 [Brassica carinata]|uniref:Uncharacterized protein n=2 Tax=Brassica TaxID=3705 RepID=A0A8X7RPS6_BRACI|nr:hypothetical protein Bca52824_049098 [Brassica carinata]CAF1816511.1 unnamed protein product [Brassica napus]
MKQASPAVASSSPVVTRHRLLHHGISGPSHLLPAVISSLVVVLLRIRREEDQTTPMVISQKFAKQVPQLLVTYKSAQYFGMCRNDLTN